MVMETESPADEDVTMEKTTEDCDEVLHELDVYISKSLGKLLLAQYPLRPTYKPYQSATRDSVRVRPVQCELEMDVKIHNTPNTPTQVQRLTVLQRPLLNPNSAIGLLRGRELYLAPLDSVIQLTPSFDHIDKRVAEEAKLNETESSTSAAPTQNITRKFTKVESDKDKAIRLSSFQNIQLERQSESWVPCDYRPPEHPYTAGQKRAMSSRKESSGIVGSEVDKSKYLDMLIPEVTTYEYAESNLTGLHDLPKMSPYKQVESLIRNAKVLSFREICSLLSSTPTDDILVEVQKCAQLIQGNWVITSKLLYPKGSSSDETGVPAEQMVRHRDFILYCFTQNSVVKRQNLTNISKIDPCEIEEILKQVSVLRPGEGWLFKKPIDEGFLGSHPAVAHSQKAMWSDLYDELYNTLHLRSHRDNALVDKRAEVAAVRKDMTDISPELAVTITNKLGMSELLDPSHLKQLVEEFRDIIGTGAVCYALVEECMCKYVPPEYNSNLLNELKDTLSLRLFSAKNQDDSSVNVIAYNKIGHSSDKFRKTVFNMFETRYEISKSELREAIHQEMQVNLSNKEYNGITSMLLASPTNVRTGVWILRIKD